MNLDQQNPLGVCDQHSTGIKRACKNETMIATYADESGELFIRDLNTLKVIAKLSKELIGGVNKWTGSIFLNEIGAMRLTDFNTLITGEGKKIWLWDIRAPVAPA